ncbi:hypothetical protein [uncultured Helicobacter sp.]|uniref:hypothetical protein n=1 Tax=uncultured Helicobacter sp. TaxID=175537 RepID=UPI0037533730
MPNINNSACASTSRAESKDVESLDSAIFATQKSNKICSASAHTAPRPLRGVQSLGQGGSSASATIALEAEKARLSPRLPCRRLASKAQQKQWRLFRGWGERGEGNTPFCEKTQDSKKLESIRENTTLRNRESTESSVDSKASIESSPTDSETSTESKEILKNEKTQILLSPCTTPSNLLFTQNPIKKLLT